VADHIRRLRDMRDIYAMPVKQMAFQRENVAALNTAIELLRRWPEIRALLVECDSELSAHGHGRSLDKATALSLSGRCRAIYEARALKEGGS